LIGGGGSLGRRDIEPIVAHGAAERGVRGSVYALVAGDPVPAGE
jgi:hypothetical protein